ncbi:hypothetical protein [Solimonas marina]|uniref:DUF1120 domain-containing protein n=1 Tax=Solimonas marina TaxID=2714601 RepID=A0A970B9U8_9GAMM|nr:hypothetical protein [Solimonas marina]NKF23724.1 hypothetical protein [Solimonas marina]
MKMKTTTLMALWGAAALCAQSTAWADVQAAARLTPPQRIEAPTTAKGLSLLGVLKTPKPVVWGNAASAAVLFTAGCSASVTGYDRCVDVSPGMPAAYDIRDLSSVTLPARASRTLVCPLISNHYLYNLMNTVVSYTTGGGVRFDPYYTIDSATLDDPSLIDPSTGQAYAGKLDLSASATYSYGTNNLRPGLPESQQGEVSRSCVGGLTADFFESVYGLPSATAEKLIAGALTIHLNLRGETTNLHDGSYLLGLRLISD